MKHIMLVAALLGAIAAPASAQRLLPVGPNRIATVPCRMVIDGMTITSTTCVVNTKGRVPTIYGGSQGCAINLTATRATLYGYRDRCPTPGHPDGVADEEVEVNVPIRRINGCYVGPRLRLCI